MHDDQGPPLQHSWGGKFCNAFRGAKLGVRGQSSFFVHFFTTAAVTVAAVVMRVSLIESCVLLICVAMVLTAEMFNSALESMARAITDQPHPQLGGALDIGSAAVLVASIGAATVGTIVFLNRFAVMIGWWG